MSDNLLYQGIGGQVEDDPLVLYDLRYPKGWERAHEDLEAWGKYRTDIYRFGLDHVVLRFRPRGAREVA
jgi:hypothetical protein